MASVSSTLSEALQAQRRARTASCSVRVFHTIFTDRGTCPRHVDLGPEDSAAVVSGGLVLYLNILKAVNDRPDEIIRLNVAPGRIKVELGQPLTYSTTLKLVCNLLVMYRVQPEFTTCGKKSDWISHRGVRCVQCCSVSTPNRRLCGGSSGESYHRISSCVRD